MNAATARATTKRRLYRGGIALGVTLPLVVDFETFLTIVMALALGLVIGGFVFALAVCFLGLGLPGAQPLDELLEADLAPSDSPTFRMIRQRPAGDLS